MKAQRIDTQDVPLFVHLAGITPVIHLQKQLNTAEIFAPVTNTFTLTTDPSLGGNNMNVARKLHTATAY